jgi:site-specific recombinase XerD
LTSDITLVPEPTEVLLNERQKVDYELYRREFREWMLGKGKEPEKYEGYSPSTVKKRFYRIDKFFRWVWDRENGYTKSITKDHADEFVDELARDDEVGESHKGNCVKALRSYFKWMHHREGTEKWEPDISFSTDDSQPSDYFTMEERKILREASLEYGSIPGYDDLNEREIDDWKTHLAQRYGKDKEKIDRDDWKRANGWKIPSIVWVSLDAGLRPCEIEKSSIDWVDLRNGQLRIPKDDSSKNRDNWNVALKQGTVEILRRWIKQRENYEKYNDTDALWLTRYSNPYQSASLGSLLKKIRDIGDIPPNGRDLSWYSIRHSTGTYMTHHEDLGAARDQLRHKSKMTTLKYDHAPIEQRQKALNRMG